MARRSEDDPRMRVWVDFLFAHQRVTRALETELKRNHGITSAQYDVLLHLGRAPDRKLRMSEVAGAILYSSGAATKLLDSLVRAGLVVRESSPDDRRTVWAA